MYVVLVRDIHRDSVRARGCSRDLDYLYTCIYVFSGTPVVRETFSSGSNKELLGGGGLEIMHPPSLRHNRCCVPTIGLKNDVLYTRCFKVIITVHVAPVHQPKRFRKAIDVYLISMYAIIACHLVLAHYISLQYWGGGLKQFEKIVHTNIIQLLFSFF